MSPPKKVVLIDDDEDDRVIFHEALHALRFAVECFYAPDGISVLNKLQEDTSSPPDYIFVDLNMPAMSGKEFLTTIKRLPAYKQIPVIILTTSHNPQDREETKQLGAFYFIIKPPTVEELSRYLEFIFSTNGIQAK